MVPNGGTVNVIYEALITNNDLYLTAAGNNNAYSWQRLDSASQWTENPVIPSGIDNIALSS